MNRVLLDQGLAPATAILLRADGWDAVHVMEAGMDRAEDLEILEFARESGRTCVTLDHDFHAHLALTQSTGPSVIFVRAAGLGSKQQAELIKRVWAACGDAISSGAAISVDGFTIRVRTLPLR